MADERNTRWLVMLNQAHNFARHSPHDAIARVDEVLREITAGNVRDPDVFALREQAKTARAQYVAALAQFRDAANERNRAYHERTQSEIEGRD